MKTTCVKSKTATGLLLIALVGQVGALKVAKQPVAVVDVNPPPPPPSFAQEEAIQREQLQQQQQFELLQQQQRQAELQIQQQQLEAQRLIGRPLPVFQQQRHEYAGGVKGASAPPPLPPPFPPQPQPQLPPFAYDQYQPPRPAIAYLVVRPPYQLPMPHDELAYRGRYQQTPLTRPFTFSTDYPRLSQPEPVYAAGTKGGRQGLQDPPPPPPPPQQPPPPPPQPQPALVVPVQGDKHGKLRAMLDKIISKLSFSSYEVAGEEYVYPTPCANCQTKQEVPIQQQPIEQQQIQQIRDEEDLTQLQQQPIQQQQTLTEQVDKDQGFDEPPKSAPQKLAEPTKQEQVKLEEFSQQQVQQQQLPGQEQELEFARQPQASKGAPQPPTRQPEPVQQQHLEELNSAKGAQKRYPQQQVYFSQQQQQQEPLRQEQKGGF